MPEGPAGHVLRDRLLGIGSEIWSAPAGPVQHAAAVALNEPPDITERIARSRSLHATVAHAVAGRFAAARLLVPTPEAAFYLYPDFAPWREHLRGRFGIASGAGRGPPPARQVRGPACCPRAAFGEDAGALRVRVATSLLYGETVEQRECALAAAQPLALPWIPAALARIDEVLADLARSRRPVTGRRHVTERRSRRRVTGHVAAPLDALIPGWSM